MTRCRPAVVLASAAALAVSIAALPTRADDMTNKGDQANSSTNRMSDRDNAKTKQNWSGNSKADAKTPGSNPNTELPAAATKGRPPTAQGTAQ